VTALARLVTPEAHHCNTIQHLFTKHLDVHPSFPLSAENNTGGAQNGALSFIIVRG